jgi:hypothetical protein
MVVLGLAASASELVLGVPFEPARRLVQGFQLSQHPTKQSSICARSLTPAASPA